VSQTLNFRSPVLVGEALCAEVEVTAVKKLRHHYRFVSVCAIDERLLQSFVSVQFRIIFHASVAVAMKLLL
jgi:acyl dehydratase